MKEAMYIIAPIQSSTKRKRFKFKPFVNGRIDPYKGSRNFLELFTERKENSMYGIIEEKQSWGKLRLLP